jgi:hypothetical protein
MAKAKGKSRLKKEITIIAIIALMIAIPLTVIMSGQQQETRQRAAKTECVYAFNSKPVCDSYCAKQEGKVCNQNLKGKWGCCLSAKSLQPTPEVNQKNYQFCSRCSDTYKFCLINWESNESCNDTWNGQYKIDCNCTQGNLDCGLKGVDTSVCKQRLP